MRRTLLHELYVIWDESVRASFKDVVLGFYESYHAMRNFLLDKKFGIKTRYNHPSSCEMSLYGDDFSHRASDYRSLERMIEYLKMGPGDVFVDLGCGKGRAALLASAQKIKKVIGIEFKSAFLEMAERNRARFKPKKCPVEFVLADVVSADLGEGTVFFLYNPFGYKTLVRVLENIRKSLDTKPRRVRIAYLNPRYHDMLDGQDWLRVEEESKKTPVRVWSHTPLKP